MSYRVMVRSKEGMELRSSTAGTGWFHRFVWSTWSSYDTEDAARAQRQEFESGGVRATVIDDQDYPMFASVHRLV